MAYIKLILLILYNEQNYFIYSFANFLNIIMAQCLKFTGHLWGGIAIQYQTMQCNAMQCNAMQCNAMQCNAMQCNAMQCNAMQCNTIRLIVLEGKFICSIRRNIHEYEIKKYTEIIKQYVNLNHDKIKTRL